MAEASGQPEGHSLISGSGLVALAQRFLVSALESSGDERLAQAGHWIQEAPELLGKKTGGLLKTFLVKRAKGQPITEQDKADFADALAENPKEAAVLMGLLTAEFLAGTADAESERKEILASYLSVFNIICAYMAKGTTSVALRGFIHDADCISYWHFERRNLEFSSGKEYLYPNGLEVYLLYEDPTDMRLVELNLAIRSSKARQLPSEDYDFTTRPSVAKLERIDESSVTLQRLDPDRANRPAQKDIFGATFGVDYTKPVETVRLIPPRPESLTGLLDSLHIAKEVLEYRRKATVDVINQASTGHDNQA